jgi:hypothetical protein
MSTSYREKHCAYCVALRTAELHAPAHAHLGRPRSEIGYQLYRCSVCHGQWSFSGRGWAAEDSYRI